MKWTVTFLNEVVRAEFLALPSSLMAATVRIVDLIEANGLEKTGMPYVRHLQGKLWEMRAKGKDGIARSMYVVARGKRIVILRCFVKKTEKTPNKELKIALQRAKEVV